MTPFTAHRAQVHTHRSGVNSQSRVTHRSPPHSPENPDETSGTNETSGTAHAAHTNKASPPHPYPSLHLGSPKNETRRGCPPNTAYLDPKHAVVRRDPHREGARERDLRDGRDNRDKCDERDGSSRLLQFRAPHLPTLKEATFSTPPAATCATVETRMKSR